MSSYLDVLKKYAAKYHHQKQYLLWSHEPYHDWTQTKLYNYTLPSMKHRLTNKKKPVPIHIMNVYTKNVFTHNFRYFYFRSKLDYQPLITNPKLPIIDHTNKKPVVVLSTYYNKDYYYGNPKTILPIRYDFIEYGYENQLLDVYGKNWNLHPFVKSIGNSRNKGDRRETKKEILNQHLFNLALENTDVPYYVTEKIWEPIKYNCLPIYRSNETIYEIFPENSFVDTRQFDDDPRQLYTYLQNMTIEEYYARLDRCQQTFNQVIENKKNITKRLSSKNHNINYLEYETCFEHLKSKLKNMTNKPISDSRKIKRKIN